MSQTETARKIIYLLLYLKDALKEDTRSKLSDQGLANLLNREQADSSEPLSLNLNTINQIRNGKKQLDPKNQAKLLGLIDSVVRRHRLPIRVTEALPRWLEVNYASRMPTLLREAPASFARQGDFLGELSNILSGAWHLFYVSPINRKGQLKAEIRGAAVFFQQTDPDNTLIEVLLISGHSRWRGHSFVNDSHLYMMVTDVGRTETAFFLTNRPTKRLLIAGLGLALERVTRPSIPAVEGIVVFGEKWKPPRIIPQTRARTRSDSADSADIQTIVERAVRGDEITDMDEKAIRNTFCVRYEDIDGVRSQHPGLYEYVQRIHINKRGGFPLTSLYVSYP